MRVLLYAVAGWLLLVGAGVRSNAAAQAAVRQRLIDPTILLVRDGNVRKTLGCTRDQCSALDAMLAKHNRMLLAIRDVGATGADDASQPALFEIRRTLAETLSEPQRLRLQGIALQAQGYDALLRTDVANELKLTPRQQQQLEQVAEEVREQMQHVRERVTHDSQSESESEIQALQAKRHRQVLAILDKPQQGRWSRLLGEPFEFSQVRPSPADAPEFSKIDAWINSAPLTMQSLRGRVVVVHFFAFGCENCIHNYPWYSAWYHDFDRNAVTIVGIHTPETQAENDNEQLRLSLKQHDLQFPVAVDKQKEMWQAYNNNIWPAVYIIDKAGRLRHWWYGELAWQGATNQNVARQQIEQLLAEPRADE